MKLPAKKRIFDIIQISNLDDTPGRIFDIFIVLVIVLNISVLFLETFESLRPYYGAFRWVEYITLAVFCAEYALRIWTAEFLYPDLKKSKAVRRFLLSYDGIVDLLTILPFFFLGGFVAFRFLRVARIFHLFRINSVYDSFNVITRVLYEKRNQLMSSVFIIWVLILAASLCMYNAEHKVQPEAFENAFSGIWYSIATIFTVGYGDIYPVTTAGRLMAVIITFLGVGAVAIPTGIISAGFVEQYTRLSGRHSLPDLSSLVIEKGGKYEGKTVEDTTLLITALVRDGEAIIPLDTTVLKVGDVLLYYETQN
ncbi:MAG: ion transporter [Lachnospiraceae bacterium]|nr:ion transporter [Lachnospiraceae bacterium]